MIFTSGNQARDGRSVNHDRRAYVDANGNRHSTVLKNLRKGQTVEEFYAKAGNSFAPRPEFAVLDNPILAEFRDRTWAVDAEWWADDLGDFNIQFWRDMGAGSWTAEQIHHARKVLDKLAALNNDMEAIN